jgi:hypothetical protein
MKFNIVLKSLKTSLAIVLVVIFASCAKQLPKPSKELKSVLVIPAEVVNKTQMERKFDYVFNFQSKPNSGSWYGNNSPQNDQLFSVRGNLQQNGNSLTIVSGLPPGEHRFFFNDRNSYQRQKCKSKYRKNEASSIYPGRGKGADLSL